ncbi:MAG: class I SAM-dependent methyltransferase [Promethearchaeota archaeon]
MMEVVKKRDIIAYYEAEGRNLTSRDIDKAYRGHYRIFSTNASRRLIIEKWLHLSKPGQTFLDVGCELGYFVRIMAQKGLHATGVDISPTKIRKARYIAKKLDIECNYSVMDGENLEFKDNSFDWVQCSETLEHILNDQQAANELIRVAKQNIIITVPQKSLFWRVFNRIRSINGFNILGAGHLREYTPESLLNLFQNSVRIEYLKACNFFWIFFDRFLCKIPIFRATLCLKLKKIKLD